MNTHLDAGAAIAPGQYVIVLDASGADRGWLYGVYDTEDSMLAAADTLGARRFSGYMTRVPARDDWEGPLPRGARWTEAGQ